MSKETLKPSFDLVTGRPTNKETHSATFQSVLDKLSDNLAQFNPDLNNSTQLLIQIRNSYLLVIRHPFLNLTENKTLKEQYKDDLYRFDIANGFAGLYPKVKKETLVFEQTKPVIETLRVAAD